ncbi:MAG: hypothetical protein M0Q21_08255 [Ignavibacteriaceae bacterium]|nr:hypothetical protein [Ignavibacteriaceae bacterium]
MNLNTLLGKRNVILIIFAILLTIVLAFIHNLSTSYSNKYDTSLLPKDEKIEKIFKSKPDTLKGTDIYYYKNAISSFEYACENKSLSELEDAKNALTGLLDKFPNSNYLADAKIKLKELILLKNRIQKRNSISEQINAYNNLYQFNNSLKLLSKSKQFFDDSEYDELRNDITKQKRNSISEQINAYNNLYQFNNSLKLLSKSKQFFDDSEYDELRNDIIKQRDKPIQVSIRELISQSSKYDGKIVEVNELRAISNDIQSKFFLTYKSTGSGRLDYDTDLRILICYAKATNRDQLIYLTGDNYPEMTVTGKFVNLSLFGSSYIDAKEIKY